MAAPSLTLTPCHPDSEVILRRDIIFTHEFSYKVSDVKLGSHISTAAVHEAFSAGRRLLKDRDDKNTGDQMSHAY